jgi:hypothetical protein
VRAIRRSSATAVGAGAASGIDVALADCIDDAADLADRGLGAAGFNRLDQ